MRSVLRPLQPGDVEAICANPRAADVREMQAQGKGFEEALRESVELSDLLGVGEFDGVPVCIFGVAMGSYVSGLGVPWMLAAQGLDRADFAFARRCRGVVRAMRARYPRLINVVDARNKRTIGWLRWLGFHIHEEPVQVNGYRFHVFSIGVCDVLCTDCSCGNHDCGRNVPGRLSEKRGSIQGRSRAAKCRAR